LRTLFLTLAMLGTAIGLSVLALQYAIYRDQNSAGGVNEQRRVAEAMKARGELDTRIAALSADHCDGPITAIFALNARSPIVAFGDIPPELAADVILCLKREIIAPEARDRLVDRNLIQFFS
jgi:hypothetical protein